MFPQNARDNKTKYASMKKILLLIFILLVYFQANAQVASYPKFYYSDGTNKPFDKEFDLMIPFKEQESLYYDYIYLYKHNGNKSFSKSLDKENGEIPFVKLYGAWKKNKTGDTVYYKVEFRYDPNQKEYSLLKPSGTYSFIFFKGITTGSNNIINALRTEYTVSGNISPNGYAYKEFEIERLRQRELNKINTYHEDFNDYILFFKNDLLPLEEEIKLKKQEDLDYKLICEGSYLNSDCAANLVNLLNNKGCILTSTRCIDTCKVSNLILSLNKINCNNINAFIKGLSGLSNIEQNEKYLKDSKFELRKANIEKSISDLYEVINLVVNFRIQLSSTQECKNQLNCLDEISNCLNELITELNNSNKRTSEILKLTSDLKSIYINSRLFIDYDVAGVNTYIYNFQARNEMAITPVFGYAYYGFQTGFSGFTPYLGFQVNFQGVNRDVPFNQIKRKTFWQRTCFTTAWTLTGIQEPNKRYDLFDKSSLITALGFKFSHIAMLNSGVLWFKKENPNALESSKSIAATPVLSLSLNLEIEKLLNGFTKLIPLK